MQLPAASLVYRFILILFLCACALPVSSPGAQQPSPPASTGGLILYAEPPSTFVEVIEFSRLTKENVRYGSLVRPDGSKAQIINAGVLATVAYPSATPSPDTEKQAAAQLQQIATLTQKYPQLRAKLDAAALKWRNAAAAAKVAAASASPRPTAATSVAGSPVSSSKAPGSPATASAGLTLTTTDGTRYDDVAVTRVDADSIAFTHSAGTATIGLSELTPELQRRFNFDPERAKAAREARKAEEKARMDAESAAASAVTSPNFRSGAHNLEAMVRAYRTSDQDQLNMLLQTGARLVAGKTYRLAGMRIRQATDEFFLVSLPAGFEAAALILFQNPEALTSVQTKSGDMIDGVVRFVSFRVLPLQRGEARLPVFECLGFQSMLGGDFVNTEKAPDAAVPAASSTGN